MKASICTNYGPPEVIEIQEVSKPAPKANEVLIKVIASTVNSGDVRVRGLVVEGVLKYIMKLVLGWSRPRKPILGVTFAGIVESVGSNVKNFGPSDQVFGLTGFRFGGHAEYTVAPASSVLMTKPKKANFEAAAAILFGGQTAIYFLHKMGIQTKKNARVLILGGTSAVGTSSIQLAKYYGAHVTTVSSQSGAELCRKLGAGITLAYDKEDVTMMDDRYDIIFDACGKYKKGEVKQLLTPNGVFKTVDGLDTATETFEQLELLSKMYDEGKLDPVIDKVFGLDDIVAAHRYVDQGRKKGNVVLTM